MNDTAKLLQQLLGKHYGMSSDEIAEEILDSEGNPKPDALKKLDARDVKRVESFKSKQTAEFQKGFDKAKAETMGKFETNFKGKYKFESDLTGEELIDSFIEQRLKGKEITEDVVKNHPAYKVLETAHKREVEKINTDWQGKLDNREKEFKREKMLTTVLDEGMKVLDKLKPKFPSGEKQRSTQIGYFRDRLKQRMYDIQQKDGAMKIIPMNPDGTKMENENGFAVDFEDVVRQDAEALWEFEKGNRGTHDAARNGQAGAGGDGSGGNGQSSWKSKITLRKPASEMEFGTISKEIYSNKELSQKEKSEAVIELNKLYRGEAATA